MKIFDPAHTVYRFNLQKMCSLIVIDNYLKKNRHKKLISVSQSSTILKFEVHFSVNRSNVIDESDVQF